MDRGRAGGFITDNNYSGLALRKKQQKEHLHRLEKIKVRKPGSSVTLDNNPPVVIDAMKKNPRKHALREYNNFVLELENKALLKRISTILTAPPRISDKDYQHMKKLCTTAKSGSKAQYEKKLEDKKVEGFFGQVKKMKAYYNHKQWEAEYQHQKFNQKFMSQVKYRRPGDFLETHVKEQHQKEEEKKKLGASHIDRIREYKMKHQHDYKNSKSFILRGSHSTVSSSGFMTTGSSSRERQRVHIIGGGGGAGRRRRGSRENNEYYNEGFENADGDGENDDVEEIHHRGNNKSRRNSKDDGNNNGDNNIDDDNDLYHSFRSGSGRSFGGENRVPLANIERMIKLTREVKANSLDNDELEALGPLHNSNTKDEIIDEIMYLNSSIECFLINRDFLVVSVICYMGEETLETEAEIASSDLSAFTENGSNIQDMKTMSTNLTFLSEVAQEVIDNVEIKINIDNEIRLILNMFSETAGSEMDSSVGDINSWKLKMKEGVLFTNNEELQSILLADHNNEKICSCGMKIPIHFLVHTSQSIGNFNLLVNLAKQSAKIEMNYALIRICATSDDQLLVSAFVLKDTLERFKKGSRTVRPAVTGGTTLRLLVSLPSIVQADPEMILSFAQNLSENLKIEHDCRTGENTLLIAS